MACSAMLRVEDRLAEEGIEVTEISVSAQNCFDGDMFNSCVSISKRARAWVHLCFPPPFTPFLGGFEFFLSAHAIAVHPSNARVFGMDVHNHGDGLTQLRQRMSCVVPVLQIYNGVFEQQHAGRYNTGRVCVHLFPVALSVNGDSRYGNLQSFCLVAFFGFKMTRSNLLAPGTTPRWALCAHLRARAPPKSKAALLRLDMLSGSVTRPIPFMSRTPGSCGEYHYYVEAEDFIRSFYTALTSLSFFNFFFGQR